MFTLEDFLLCEDARREVVGAMTLTGYMPPGSVLRLPRFPAQLEKLTCVLALGNLPGVDAITFHPRISRGDQKVFEKAPVTIRRKAPGLPFETFTGVLRQIPLDGPGVYLTTVEVTAVTGRTAFSRFFIVDQFSS